MKKVFEIRGGLRLPANKTAADSRIETAPAPPRVVLHLSQHKGAPSKLIAAKGDLVSAGEIIAEADGHISLPLHASISGKITEITKWLHPVTGRAEDAVVIESDGQDRHVPKSNEFFEYYRRSPKELIEVIRKAGVAGLGGAAFPAHVKLSLHGKHEIDALLINGAECEPYLSCDDRLMRENARDIVEGVKIMMYVLHALRAVIAVENDKPEAIAKLREVVFNEPNIDLAVIRTKYPAGNERQLIKAVLGKEIPMNRLPFQFGIVVHNAATAYAAGKAVKEGEPLISRVVTVAGSAVRVQKNLRVRVGTLLSDVAGFCGGALDGLGQAVMGGPMTGTAQPSLDVPVLKGTSCVIFMSAQEILPDKYAGCFRCGRCVRACPVKLLPNMLSVNIEMNRLKQASHYRPLDCIECGGCSYSCPAKRPIMAQIKQAKFVLNAHKDQ
jgi:Na+-translocating ferredoxin:NAD+ oxidoreductase subunit C